MEQITIQVRDSGKAQLLLKLLASLDFVESLMVDSVTSSSSSAEIVEASESFFDYAGMWAERDIDLDSIRQHAWPRR